MTFEIKSFPLEPGEEYREDTSRDLPVFSPYLNPDDQGLKIESAPGVTEPMSIGEAAHGDWASLAMQPIYGFNEVIVGLPQSAVKYLATRLGVENADKWDILRYINTGDYENVEKVGGILGELGITKGIGSKVGPQGIAEKIARGIGTGVGYAVPFGAATNLAAKGAIAATGSSQAAQQLYAQNVAQALSKAPVGPKALHGGTAIVKEALVKPYIKNPGSAGRTEALIGGLAGGGMEAGGEAAAKVFGEEYRPYGELAGGFSAPFAILGAKSVVGTVKKVPSMKAVQWATEKAGPHYQALKEKVISPRKIEGEVATSTSKEAVKARERYAKQLEKVKFFEDPTIQKQVLASEEEASFLGPHTKQGKVEFSPAEQTRIDALAKQQRDAEVGMSTENREKNIARKQNIIEGADNFLNNKYSLDVNDNPVAFYDQGTKKLHSLIGTMDEGINNIYSKMDVLLDDGEVTYKTIKYTFPRTAAEDTKAFTGTQMRKSIQERKNASKEKMDKLAEKLKINDDVIKNRLADKEEMATIQKALKDELGTKTKLSGSYHNLVERFLAYDVTNKGLSFKDYKNFLDEIKSGQAKAHAFDIKKDKRELAALNKTFDKLGKTFGKRFENFETFLKRYKEEHLDIYSNPTVQRILNKKAGTTQKEFKYELADEKVAAAFFVDTNTAREFKTLYGKEGTQSALWQENLNHMRNHIGDELLKVVNYNSATPTGKINLQKIDNWMVSKGEVLTELGLFKEFRNAGDALRLMQNRVGSLKARKKKIEGNLLYKNLSEAMNTRNPDAALDSALFGKSKNLQMDTHEKEKVALLNQLVKVARNSSQNKENPELLEALRNSVVSKIIKRTRKDKLNVVDEIINSSANSEVKAQAKLIRDDLSTGGNPIFSGNDTNPDSFLNVLAAYEPQLKTVLGKEHFTDLIKIGSAVRRITITPAQPGTMESPLPFLAALAESAGTSISSITARTLAIKEKRISPQVAASVLAVRFINANQTAAFKKLVEESILDPSIARELAKKQPVTLKEIENGTAASAGLSEETTNKVKMWMFQMGLPTSEEISPSEAEPVPVTIPLSQAEPPVAPDMQVASTPNPTPPIPPVTPDMIPKAEGAGAPPNTAGKTSSMAQSLFPFDSTSMAIASRNQSSPKAGGIASLV